ncbi:Phosphoribosyl pyrophosphate synthase-associated protein 1 [Toxocara canis]|uniref:Phosphoribosyl pyrophosphate synthase-associated protein 1 n=1 Tax=Toxocara canis TaxID=6265 RepID=A0A0B2VN03_TOXCA|nr:Phosphoribosyl pyrophosphate synthase-associated protein 1 [Toxocara canis]
MVTANGGDRIDSENHADDGAETLQRDAAFRALDRKHCTNCLICMRTIGSIAVIHGEQKDVEESGLEDGRQSPPPNTHDNLAAFELFPAQVPKEKPPLTVVGDVGGRIAIMVDDIIDDAQSFVAAAEVLKNRGAYKIYVIATHGLLSADAPGLLESSPITEEFNGKWSLDEYEEKVAVAQHMQVIVTNTVPHEVQKMRCHKIKTVDISLMLSEAIRRIYHNESMGQLFRDVTIDD